MGLFQKSNPYESPCIRHNCVVVMLSLYAIQDIKKNDMQTGRNPFVATELFFFWLLVCKLNYVKKV